MKREIDVLKNIPVHPNICRLIKAITTQDKLYLVMELCEEGDLDGFLKKRGGRLLEHEARHVVRDILRGLCFMYEKCHVMH